MVIVKTSLKLTLVLFLFCLSAFGNEVRVSSEIDADTAHENQPMSGTITVVHDQDKLIDEESFRLGKDKLAVDLVKEVKFNSENPLMLTIYRFHLPGKSEGLYALPPVEVKVGDQTFRSIMTSYTVKPGSKTDEPAPKPAVQVDNPHVFSGKATSTVKPSLRLEAVVEGPISLYPGQHTKLVYRYYYTGDIKLTSEKLPLLDAEGMLKVGEKEIKEFSKDEVSISEISQEVQAVDPGNFSFGPSFIEGYASSKDASSQQEALESTAPAVELTVLPFPEAGRPGFFNGAIGEFQFKTYLQGSSVLSLGDEIALVLEISGQGNFQTVNMPNLASQPGFGGFFRLNDLPPQEEVHGQTKKIVVRLRPLTDKIKEIPSVNFSSFDPETQHYSSMTSQAIPITIKAAPTRPNEAAPVTPVATPSPPKEKPAPEKPMPEKKDKPPVEKEREMTTFTPQPIEIEGIYSLSAEDLHNKLFGTWWSLALLPLGLGFLIYQWQLRNYLQIQKQRFTRVSSEDLLASALQQPAGSAAYFEGISRALKQALFDARLITSNQMENRNLPETGLGKQVKDFMAKNDEQRFTGQKKIDYASIALQARKLLEAIRKP